MSTSAQYAATAYIGSGTTITADTSTTAPTTSTVGVIATATTTDVRIDNIDVVCQGTSVAGLHRLWLCEGNSSPTISSITSSATTAILTTATNHNLITGDLITIRGAFPVEYNVVNTSISVLSATTFFFVIVSTGNVAARDVGTYSSTHTAPNYHLIKEVPIIAITGSATANAAAYAMSSAQNGDFLPLVLPKGWSLRTTVSVTQTNAIKTTARGGQF